MDFFFCFCFSLTLFSLYSLSVLLQRSPSRPNPNATKMNQVKAEGFFVCLKHFSRFPCLPGYNVQETKGEKKFQVNNSVSSFHSLSKSTNRRRSTSAAFMFPSVWHTFHETMGKSRCTQCLLSLYLSEQFFCVTVR